MSAAVIERRPCSFTSVKLSDGTAELIGATVAGPVRITGDGTLQHPLRAVATLAQEAGADLLKAARPLVAMTFAEARTAEDKGNRLLFCQYDVLNPCWSGSWSKEHGPGKHWGGGEACPECSLRAAIAKATGSAS